MELGILITPEKSLDDTLQRYQRCMRDIDPDHIWLPDRLLIDDISALSEFAGNSYQQPPMEFLDPFLTIAAMAQSPMRPAHFGLAVTDFIRRAPPDLARTAYTLHQIVGSALHMGFGAGEAVNLTPLGYRHGPKPVGHFATQLQRFSSINQSGFDAPHETDKVALGYHRRPNLIWIGGQRERMLKLTAQYADGWLPAWKMTPGEYAEKAGILRSAAADHGRPCPKLGMFGSVILGKSKTDVLDCFERNPLTKAIALQASAEIWEQWGLQHPAGSDSRGFFDVLLGGHDPAALYSAITSVPAGMLADILFLGNVQEVFAELQEYRTAGLQHLAMMFPLFADNNVMFGMADFYPDFVRLCKLLRQPEPCASETKIPVAEAIDQPELS
jgi:phthiodiolone/phenolphthiodiolone dimycocerosates ketoreductase